MSEYIAIQCELLFRNYAFRIEINTIIIVDNYVCMIMIEFIS